MTVERRQADDAVDYQLGARIDLRGRIVQGIGRDAIAGCAGQPAAVQGHAVITADEDAQRIGIGQAFGQTLVQRELMGATAAQVQHLEGREISEAGGAQEGAAAAYA